MTDIKRMIYVVEETHDDAPELIDWYFTVKNRTDAMAELTTQGLNFETWQFEYAGPLGRIQQAIRKEKAKREGNEPVITANTPYNYVCAKCGDDDLVYDATVHWQKHSQKWVMNEVLHDISPYCPTCEGEVRDERQHDESIKVVEPFTIPDYQTAVNTPKDISEIMVWLNALPEDESIRVTATHGVYMMFNLMVRGMHTQRHHYETIFEQITGESRPWEAQEEAG